MALKEISPHPPSNKKFSISLRWLMVLGFGGLVALAMTLVLTMSVVTNFSNTYSLLNARAFELIDAMERSVRSQTNQAERTVRALAKLHEDGVLAVGKLDQEKTRARQASLKSMMVTSPVIEALLIYDTQGKRSGVYRDPQGDFIAIPFEYGAQNELTALLATNPPEQGKAPVWGEPIVVNNILFHNVGFPLVKNGKITGVAVAAIGQSTMNKIIVDLGRDNSTTAFVLTNDNKVIAHSKNSGYFSARTTIDIKDFPDAALHQFPQARQIELAENSTHQNMKIYESGRGVIKTGYVFIVRELKGYSAKPYRLVAYFGKAAMGEEIRRILGSLMAGIAALLLAVLSAFFLSRRLARPMKNMAKVANDFANLDLDNFTTLPGSHIREIDNQAMAMNSMHTALGEFSRYVPRPLVKRLLASGVEATRSVEREITIMFADIANFTTMSEDLNATQTAALLNSHFDMLCSNINRHNGTIDKFIGDGLMAFWGAPDADDNQAVNAIKAANDIMDGLKDHNVERAAKSLPPLRLRIGIHTGRVVVGNIGSCDRHNYTIVGDAVNVANRLEQYGKNHIGESEVIVLTSRTTWEKAGNPEAMQTLGLQKMRGREALIEIFALHDRADKTPEFADSKKAG